mmetsp:Transcript_5331/g.21514  ORF Transcript_5331/g.21514 Transcript_5331/m.21514 type:complete len:257 (+) Transcript_5331:618-1388(+)
MPYRESSRVSRSRRTSSFALSPRETSDSHLHARGEAFAASRLRAVRVPRACALPRVPRDGVFRARGVRLDGVHRARVGRGAPRPPEASVRGRTEPLLERGGDRKGRQAGPRRGQRVRAPARRGRVPRPVPARGRGEAAGPLDDADREGHRRTPGYHARRIHVSAARRDGGPGVLRVRAVHEGPGRDREPDHRLLRALAHGVARAGRRGPAKCRREESALRRPRDGRRGVRKRRRRRRNDLRQSRRAVRGPGERSVD